MLANIAKRFSEIKTLNAFSQKHYFQEYSLYVKCSISKNWGNVKIKPIAFNLCDVLSVVIYQFKYKWISMILQLFLQFKFEEIYKKSSKLLTEWAYARNNMT